MGELWEGVRKVLILRSNFYSRCAAHADE